MIKLVLFDLDGTLLPLDEKKFMEIYFGLLSKRMIKFGFDPEKFIASVWQGTKMMVLNDGKETNEFRFWEEFKNIYGDSVMDYYSEFEDYYATEFDNAKMACSFNEKAIEAVSLLKSKNISVALATNPIFPQIATKKRINWAGFKESDFLLYTTYENSHYAKPNPKYYLEVIEKLGFKAEECLMVGNDVSEDVLPSLSLGMKSFLITDCMLNKKNIDITNFDKGSFTDLIEYINKNI